MQTSQAVRTLTRNDTKLVTRDSFLIMMALYAFGLAVILRFVVPWLTNTLAENYAFDLVPYYPMITGFLIVTIGPQLAGTVFGYLLLDEKDGDTLKALMVTPLSLDTFLSYRVVIAWVFGFIIALGTFLIIDLVHIPLYQTVLIAAVAALYAPIAALFYATIAKNKVEAFALLKITGMLAFIPIAAWFVNEPWQYLFGLFPPYWATKALWVAAEGGSTWWLFLLVGLVTSLAVIWWLVRRFNETAHKV
jgi:fluoroquinolone transport system permease protein